MKPVVIKFPSFASCLAAALLMIVLSTTASAQTTRPATSQASIAAHGQATRFWLAARGLDPNERRLGEMTRVYVRRDGESQWTGLMDIPGPVVELASRGTQLAVVTSDGQWLLATDKGPSSGRPLPAPAKLVTLGSGDQTLWAIGQLPPRAASTATTGPATSMPSLTTAPALNRIEPSEKSKLILYTLEPAGWSAVAELPPEIEPGASTRLSLSHFGGMPYLAQATPEGGLIVWRRPADAGEWKQWAVVQPSEQRFAIDKFKLLSDTDVPVVWTAGAGRERLWFFPAKGPQAVDVDDATGGARAAAFANGAIRLARIVDGKLMERAFDSKTGAAMGAMQPVTLPGPSATPLINMLMNTALALALLVAIGATIVRRGEIQGAVQEIDKLALAPLGPRLLAGIVDAAPMLLALAWASWQVRRDFNPAQTTPNVTLASWITLGAGAIVYFLHVTLGEALAGRSLGKILFKLRVVRMNGEKLKPGAVVVRNVLRLIDWSLLFVPLLLMAFLPLRQRPGDVVAGTLVVQDGVKEEEPADAEPTAPA